jgi:hypothetical protein
VKVPKGASRLGGNDLLVMFDVTDLARMHTLTNAKIKRKLLR